jgi:phosphoglycolate phosphatase
MVGKGSEKLIRDVLALDYDAARIDAVFDEAMAAYQRHYLAINGERSTLYPEVLEGLQALQARPAPGLRDQQADRVRQAAAGAEGPGALLRAGLRRRFAAAQEAGSPAAAAGLRRFRPGAGDGGGHRRLLNDAEAARAAGCFVLTVPYGYNHGKPVQTINSDGIVGSLLDAAKLISAHNSTAN